jgi:hypothetical protein
MLIEIVWVMSVITVSLSRMPIRQMMTKMESGICVMILTEMMSRGGEITVLQYLTQIRKMIITIQSGMPVKIPTETAYWTPPITVLLYITQISKIQIEIQSGILVIPRMIVYLNPTKPYL